MHQVIKPPLEQRNPTKQIAPNSETHSREKRDQDSRLWTRRVGSFKCLARKYADINHVPTGVFGAVCARHGFPLYMMNMDGGEKYCYADTILDKVLEKTPPANTYLFYDIVCQYKKHLEVGIASFMSHTAQQLTNGRKIQIIMESITPCLPFMSIHMFPNASSFSIRRD
jgi:hypothetical protein